MRLLIADDHPIVRKGLKGILLDDFKPEDIGEAENVAEVLQLVRTLHWDVILLDINMPGGGGMEALKQLKQEHPDLPVLMLSIHSEEQYALRVLKAGASGYLSKNLSPEDLRKAIRKVLAGGTYVSDHLAERLVDHIDRNTKAPPHAALSDREFQVMRLIASGKTTNQIADDLALSAKTISAFRNRIFTKMGMKNAAEVTRYIIENNLL